MIISTNDRTHSDSKKWHKYAGKDILPMWVADSDFEIAKPIQEALEKRLTHPVFGYPYDEADFLEAIVNHCQSQYDWQIDPSWIVSIPGCVPGLNFSRAISIAKGKKSGLVLMPTYPPFFDGAELLEFNHQKIYCRLENNQWSIDFEGIKKEITQDTGLLMLCHPHNPIGKVYQDSELMQFATIAKDHDLIVCSDEIHCDLVLNGQKHRPFASLNEDTLQRSITLMAASKTFNIAGLCCAFAIIANPTIRHQFRNLAKGLTDVNVLGRVATTAALNEGKPWLKAQIDYLNENVKMLESCVARLNKVSMSKMEATYLAFLDCRALQLENPQRYFESKGLGFADGADYGMPGFVRVNLACSHELLAEAILRLEKAVNEVEI